MKKRLCAFLSALLLLAALPGGASAYAKGETGTGAASCTDLGGYHFAFHYSDDKENRVMYVQRLDGDARYGTVLREITDAVNNMGINPAYLSARYDEKGSIVLKVQDIYNGDFQYTAVYSTAELDRLLEKPDIGPAWLEQQAVSDGGVKIGLVQVGWRDGESVAAINANAGQEDSYPVLISGQPWGGHIRLLPYNGKTFMLMDTDTHQLFASENGTDWICLSGTDARPSEEIENYESVSSAYSFLWTGEEYMSCRRVIENTYFLGREGTRDGFWYDPACTKVCFYDENFNLTTSHDFGRQVCSVGYYGGVYYAEVSDCESVSGREYDHGSTTLYASTDKENWEKTDVMNILRSLRGNE